MKHTFYFILPILLFWSVSYSQPIYISSYNDTAQKVFFCNGIRQNILGLDLVLVNLNPKPGISFYVDSIVYICNSDNFQNIRKHDSIDVSGFAFLGGPIYAPKSVSQTDTLIIRAFYGQAHSDGRIICYSIQSPDIGLYGISKTYFELFPGNALGSYNTMLAKDTLHDIFTGAFSANGIPNRTGFNNAVRLISCGVMTIDSIYEVGDFSEIKFFPGLPTLPVTMKSEDSLVIPYFFTPSIVGNSHHYLIFHITTGQYLVWSFEYQVFPSQGVKDMSQIDAGYTLFPNPTIGKIKLHWYAQSNSPKSILLFDEGGRQLKNILLEEYSFTNGLSIDIDLSNLPSGGYSLLVANKSMQKFLKVSIVR